MRRLTFAPAARDDLLSIFDGIATDNPDRALSFLAELDAKARAVAERPFSFPARDDLLPGLRSAVHGRYLLFFRADDADVRIVRVLHGARDLGAHFPD